MRGLTPETVVAHYEYDPFGNTTVASGDKSDDFAYRFSTKPIDKATGLYYYGYRWYDPLIGRWPSRDPSKEAGGLNVYGFVKNDGINYFDLFGLIERTGKGHHVFAFAELKKHEGISECIKVLLEQVQIGTISSVEEGHHRRSRAHIKYEAVSKGAMDDAVKVLLAQGIDVSKECSCDKTMKKILTEFQTQIDKSDYAKAFNTAVSEGINDPVKLNEMLDDFNKNGTKKGWLKNLKVGGRALGKLVNIASIVSVLCVVAEGNAQEIANEGVKSIPVAGNIVTGMEAATDAITEKINPLNNSTVQEDLDEVKRLLGE